MLAQAKELAVAVKNLIDIIPALGERNAEVPARDILLVRFNAVDCADIRRIFFGRKQFLAVACAKFEKVRFFFRFGGGAAATSASSIRSMAILSSMSFCSRIQ